MTDINTQIELKQTYTIDTPPDTNDYIRHTDQLCSSIDKKRQQLEHDYYSMQMMSESVLNSTPAPPTPNFHAIFNLNNYNTATDLNSLKQNQMNLKMKLNSVIFVYSVK